MQYTLTRSAVHNYDAQLLTRHLQLTDYSEACPARMLLAVLFAASVGFAQTPPPGRAAGDAGDAIGLYAIVHGRQDAVLLLVVDQSDIGDFADLEAVERDLGPDRQAGDRAGKIRHQLQLMAETGRSCRVEAGIEREDVIFLRDGLGRIARRVEGNAPQ